MLLFAGLDTFTKNTQIQVEMSNKRGKERQEGRGETREERRFEERREEVGEVRR